MFDKDFYPTPESVLDMMGIDCAGKITLDPQAGSGNIVQYLHANGAKDVISCEKHPDLAEIVKTKSRFLKNDFFKVIPEEISHVNLIVMNPPFSKGIKHILHAWNTAPDGCEIISLINYDNIHNDYSRERKELSHVISDYGNVVNLGAVFTDAPRMTKVPIGLIKLYKPNNSGGDGEFEGFFLDEEDNDPQGVGIMPYNKIRDIVQRYIGSVKCFEEHLVINEKMNNLNSLFGVGGFTCTIGYNNTVHTKEEYKKELQKKAWKYVFDVMNMEKYVTSGVMKDINSFVENRKKLLMKTLIRCLKLL